jgi:uncharacterized repeat protein (TIGR01451 family)
VAIDASQATPNPVLLGEEQRFAYTITNDGAGIASGVIFSVTLPAETTFVSCSSTIGTCAGPGSGAGGQVNTTIGSMAPGNSGAITIIVKATTYNFYGYTVLATASTSTSERDRSSGTVSTFAQVVQPNPTPLTGITAIGTGFAQSYAVKNGGGAALAWGANDFSQLGDGTRTDRLIPVTVSGLTGVVAIQGGYRHGIALQANGKVWTWGDNSYGQLGDGSTVSRKIPAQVASLSNILAIDAGDSFNLALRNDGTVWAWGINNKGQLGDGTTVTRTQPVQVQGMSNIKAIAAGVDLSLAIDSGGTVWAWGNNGAGALGDGTTVDRLIPVKTAGLANVIAVSAGGLNFGNFDGSTSSASFSLALKSDGTVWSWGDSHFGNLGDGGFGGRFTPAQISGLNGITAISAGREHGVALKSDGTVWCWGYNSMGLLGIGSSEVGPKTPVKVLWLRNIKAIAAGGEHTIALSQDGRVFGWGNGFNGQLGTGLSGGSRNYPLDVSQQAPDPAPLGVLSTPTFSPDGGTFHGSQNVSVLSASATTQIQLVSAGGLHALALTDDGVLWGWGSSSFGQLGIKPNDLTPLMATPNPIAIGGVTNISKIAAGSSHNVILKSDGTVWTWGSNSSGELGLGVDDYYRWVPAQVPGLTGVTAVYAGPGNSYALKSDGTVWFWGSRQPNFTHVKTPVQVSGISNVTAFAVGGNHTLALRSDGTVWAWGANEYGQLGNGNNINSDTPVQVTGLSGITGISASGSNSAAIRSDGTVFIWGNNQYWQLATGDFDSNVHSTPVPVSGLSGVTSVSIGGAVVALKSDGTVWAWGQNYHGELGDGTTMYRPTPIQIPGLAGITAISGAGSFTMALGADHRLWIWGRNDYGQFGDGTLETWTVPYNMDRLTGGIAIHYTTDGSDPTENDAVVAAGGTLLVDHGLTLKARAFKAGWSPSAVKSATFTITGSNPIDEASTFVRQQYLDFLSREPDAGGWTYWTGEITKCGSDEQCIHDRRVGVADAFFFEPEFQESGAYIYRVYRAALGRQPTFAQFNGDRGLVVGGPGLDQSKTDYVLAAVKRDEFLGLYPRSQTAAQFVTALLSRIKSTDNVDLSAKLETLKALYDGSDNGRAAILRQVADDSSFIDAEYNTCFVLMEYFGYLRRDPDQEGYNFWLGQVNRFPLRSIYIQHAMVCSFITSFEYQLRFGQTITHSNRECPQ